MILCKLIRSGCSAIPIVRQPKTLWHLQNHTLNFSKTLVAPRYKSSLCSQLPESVRNILQEKQITEPTLVQEKTVPFALENKDIVGIARTGSGKTLAFAVPVVSKILSARASEGSDNHNGQSLHERLEKSPTAVILAPTRELAAQIADVFAMFRPLKIRTAVLVGGADRANQVRQLESSRFDVFIATPGRLNDLLDDNIVDLSKAQVLVLDEADRMLDMGMEPQVRKIIEHIPRERQTLMFSATWPDEVKDLANDFMNEFEYVPIDSEQLKANPNIKQEILICQSDEKMTLLLDTIKKINLEADNKALLFVNMKRKADFISRQMYKYRIDAITTHGDKTQRQRDQALEDFKRNRSRLMIATDVAARGLDIKDITHVINFDFPSSIEDYIHRIGRTARHNNTGTAISFVTEEDAKSVKKLIKVLRETGQEVSQELLALLDVEPSRDIPYRPRRPQYNSYQHSRRSSSYQNDDYERRPYDRRTHQYGHQTDRYQNRPRGGYDRNNISDRSY